jgi:hypothetical protein
MTRRPSLRSGAALVVGIVLGAALTIAVQSAGLQPAAPGRHQGSPDPSIPVTGQERPTTFLAWAPAGIPGGFGARVRALDGIDHVTVVAEDNTWMTRSWTADGEVADRPRAPYAIPIDAAAVDTGSFADFLPPDDRGLLVDLAKGQGILGATSAELRGLGPGAVLRFRTGAKVTIAGVLPDELVGASELMVSKATGARIGVTHERYLLLQPSPGRLPASRRLSTRLRTLLPPSLSPTYRKVQVRAPGETPYLREGDAVLPPVLIKVLFGEFAAMDDPTRPGYLRLDPAWVRHHIVTTTVPILGRVTCNEALIPQLRGAMSALERQGLAGTIHVFNGCFAPRYINRNASNLISHHAWGIAFDCNAASNPFGLPPHQDPRLVRVMARWGFIWGGTFIVPDGNHFEYRFSPSSAA